MSAGGIKPGNLEQGVYGNLGTQPYFRFVRLRHEVELRRRLPRANMMLQIHYSVFNVSCVLLCSFHRTSKSSVFVLVLYLRFKKSGKIMQYPVTETVTLLLPVVIICYTRYDGGGVWRLFLSFCLPKKHKRHRAILGYRIENTISPAVRTTRSYIESILCKHLLCRERKRGDYFPFLRALAWGKVKSDA